VVSAHSRGEDAKQPSEVALVRGGVCDQGSELKPAAVLVRSARLVATGRRRDNLSCVLWSRTLELLGLSEVLCVATLFHALKGLCDCAHHTIT
jgi:hypothetical protein